MRRSKRRRPPVAPEAARGIVTRVLIWEAGAFNMVKRRHWQKPPHACSLPVELPIAVYHAHPGHKSPCRLRVRLRVVIAPCLSPFPLLSAPFSGHTALRNPGRIPGPTEKSGQVVQMLPRDAASYLKVAAER